MAFFKTVVLLALVGTAVCMPSYGYAPAAPAKKAAPQKVPAAYAPPAYAAAPAAAPEKAYYAEAAASNTQEEEENLPPRDYNFNYKINDHISPLTHVRTESQKAGVIQGEYMYTRPDNVMMKVTYTADKDGFHPVMTEAAANLQQTGEASYSMDLPDAPEPIKVSVTEEELEAYKKAEADRAHAEEYPTPSAYGYEAPRPAAPAPAAPAAPAKAAYY